MESKILVWQALHLQERLLIVFFILLAIAIAVIYYLEYFSTTTGYQKDERLKSFEELELTIFKANDGDVDAIEICKNDFRVTQDLNVRDDGGRKHFQLTSVARQHLDQLRC